MNITVRTCLLAFLITFAAFSQAESGDNGNFFQGTERIGGYYLNGDKEDEVNGIAIDAEGNIIVTGTTNSLKQIVFEDGHQAEYGGGESDAFLIKYNTAGKIIWSTYFGGSGLDRGLAVKLTNDGKIFICGSTTSENGISYQGFQNTLAGGTDGFIAYFEYDGNLIWSSYFGGANEDVAKNITADNNGNIIICGTTNSTGLADAGAFQPELNGSTDAFVLKLTPSYDKNWVTYFGGEDADTCNAVVTDNSDKIIIAGSTLSAEDIASPGAAQGDEAGGQDAFIAVFKPDGQREWSTYLGGSKTDYALGLACDSKNNILVSGCSDTKDQTADDIVTWDAFLKNIMGKAGGAMIVKYSPAGERLYGSFFGYPEQPFRDTTISTTGYAIVCDSSDSYILTGWTKRLPYNTGAWQPNPGGGFDAFAVKFNEGNKLIWSTYYGGEENDFANCLAFDNKNNIYIAGKTNSGDNISDKFYYLKPPDGFFASLTGYANVIFNLILADQTKYPVLVTVSDIIDTANPKEIYRNEFDEDDTVAFDAGRSDGPYKIIVTPANTHIYQSLYYKYKRAELLKLDELDKCFFSKNNDISDNNRKGNFSYGFRNSGIYGEKLYWPSNSDYQYIFGGGLWFGAQKINPETGMIKKYIEMTYNPNNGGSWMVPGRYEDDAPFDNSVNVKYRAVNSEDYNKSTGEFTENPQSPAWPVWKDNSSGELKKFGAWVYDLEKRGHTFYPGGPLFFSDEDIVSVYNDSELNYFDGDTELRKTQGYPLGLQFEQVIYTWEDPPVDDVLIISWKIINISNDTLFNCWAAPLIDYDLAIRSQYQSGATNDRGRYYNEEKSLGLAAGWSDTTRGEAGMNFGYIGFSLLQTPAVDQEGFLRNDKQYYEKEEQLGLATYRNWPIENDPLDDDAVYNFLSASFFDGDQGPGDKRTALATGPFNFHPGDTAKVVLLINFAPTASGLDATGTAEDMSLLVERKKEADKFWYGYLSPVPETPLINTSGYSKVIPNPSSESINICYSLPDQGFVRLNVFDMFGNKVYGKEKFGMPGIHHERIDITHLNPGTYCYVISGTGSINSGKFIITR